MRKRIFGRKLKRTTNQRKGLFKSLAQAMVLHGRIKTTEAKAKAVRGEIEKLITIAKKHDKNAMQFLQKHVPQKTAEAFIRRAPAFKDRAGGYTRIVKLGDRIKDNAPMVILEFVEKMPVEKTPIEKVKGSKKKEVKKEEKKVIKKPVLKKK
jgi:large subunit ribosomal protein L17